MATKEAKRYRNDLPADELISYYADLYREQTVNNPCFNIPIPEKPAPRSDGRQIISEETTPDGFVIVRGCDESEKPFVKLNQYIGTETEIKVPADITEIGDRCFEGKKLRKIVMPENIKGLWAGCFSHELSAARELLAEFTDETGCCIIGVTLIRYFGSDSTVTIPEGVAKIADWAFYKNESIKTVYMPKSIREIGEGSFSSCTGLTAVIFSVSEDSLEIIGDKAFDECSALKSIDLPKSVRHIAGSWAFRSCIPSRTENGFEILGNILIRYTGDEKEIIIPDGISVIMGGTFAQKYISKAIIPEGVTLLCGCFMNHKELKEVSLPASLKAIDKYTFSSCSSLTRIDTKNVLYIGHSAFSECENLTSIKLSNHLRSIDSWAFYSCQNLTEVIIPGTVRSIGDYAFDICRKLKKVILSEGLEEIGSSCFSGTSALESLNLPSTVRFIGKNAFQYCGCNREIKLPEALEAKRNYVGIPDKNGCFVENGILTRINLARDEALTITDGVVVIEEEAIGFRHSDSDCRQIILPDSVREIRDKDFGRSRDLIVNIPGGYLLQRRKLPPEPIKNLLDRIWKNETSMLDWVSIYLFQDDKSLIKSCEKAFSSAPNAFAAACLAVLGADSTPEQIDSMAGIVYDLRENTVQELLDRFWQFANEQKAKKAASILAPVVSTTTSVNGDMEESRQDVLYGFCNANFEKAELNKMMKKAGIKETLFVQNGVKYSDSGEDVSAFVLECAVVPYIGQMTERPKHIGNYKTDMSRFIIMKNCDEIASHFEKTTLASFLDKLSGFADGYENVQLWIPVCRYGNIDQMKALISEMNAWSDWDKCGAGGRSGIMVAAGALMLSDTREAMMYAEKRGQLKYYAKIRGTTANAIRDTQLADFGFDENGKKTYDLGTTVIEASVGNDLTVSLYDTAAGKIVKSLPKKNAEPAKFDACSADYADLKKNVKKVVKARNDLLFEYFLSGQKTDASSWIDAYTGNPVLNKVARLLVWSQGNKTFTLNDSGAVDSNGKSIRISTSTKIAVAHPLEMSDDDILRWQKYFVSKQLKQPFEQIWEAKIDGSSISPDRYKGCMIPYYRFLHQEKNGITVSDYDFHNDINIYLDSLDATINRIDWASHRIEMNDRFEITSIKVEKLSRKTNHLIFYFDKCTTFGRIANDDDTVLESLRGYTVAQIDAFLKYAIENKCTKCTAGLLAFKNKYFADFAEVDEFTLN